jgi:hypothetical protein
MDSHPSSEQPEPGGATTEMDNLRAVVRGTAERPGLTTLLPLMQGRHQTTLRLEEHWTSRDLVRHPEPRELVRSMRKLGNRDADGRLVRTVETRRSVTDDVLENRFVRNVTDETRRRLVALDDDEARSLIHELDAARHLAPFLRQVAPLERPVSEPTIVLTLDPLYRSVFQIWRDRLR